MAFDLRRRVSESAGEASKRGFDDLPWYTVPGLLLGIPLLVSILVQLNRRVFWDNFVWKYYWGPIRADAAGRNHLCTKGMPVQEGTETTFGIWTREVWSCTDPAGVAAGTGYNTVNTLSWAVLLGLCIVGLAQILRHRRQPMDTAMIVGATGWVVAGSLWHVVEDTDLILPPVQYLLITPPIYLLFGAFGVLSFLFGGWLRDLAERTNAGHAMRQSWFLMMLLVLGYTYLWRNDWDGVVRYVNPIWVALAAAATQLVLWWDVRRRREIVPSSVLVIYTLGWIIVAVVYLLEFQSDPWKAQGANAMPSALWLAPLLAGAITYVVYLVGKAATAKGKVWGPAYTHPVSLLLVFSQVVDGVATSIGLDLAGYVEKHVLSDWVIQTVGNTSERIGFEFGSKYRTFIGFLPIKTALALFVVYVIDVSGREDAAKNPVLMGLVKFAIIMVGIGPGVRDFVRLALGV